MDDVSTSSSMLTIEIPFLHCPGPNLSTTIQQHHCLHLIHSQNQILPLKTHPLNLHQLTQRCRWKEHQSPCIARQNMSNQPGKHLLGRSHWGGRMIWSWVHTSQNYPFMWAAGVDSGVEVGLPVTRSMSLYHHMTNDFRI